MHEELVRLACSLDERRAVLDMIFETLIKGSNLKHIGCSDSDTIRCLDFLKCICADQTKITGVNPLVSIYTNYIDRKKSPEFILRSANMEMTTYDIKLLCDASHDGLKYLDLSGNWLTNLIDKLVFEDDLQGFRSLEIIDVSNTGLSTADVKSLFTALRNGNFPKLKKLHFLPAPLTDCVDVILQAVDHLAFPFSKELILQKCGVRKDNRRNIHKILCEGKLRDLREIDLSDNVLPGCMIELLGDDDLRFENLKTIDVSNTGLSTADVKSLFIGLRDRKFPKLKELYFLPAPLTDCLGVILETVDHPAFPFSGKLLLKNSSVNKEDIKSIHKAFLDGELQNLWMIDLSDNVLTDCMIDLLGEGDFPIFSSLKMLNLNNSQLGPADVKCLFTALRSGKFPNLQYLYFLPAIMTDCLAHILSCEEHHSLWRGGYPLKRVLPLQNAALTNNDLKSLFRATPLRKTSFLKNIELSDNILTNGFEEALNTADLVTYPLLTHLEIARTELSAGDITVICSAVRSPKFPKLRCHLGDLFAAAVPQELQKLRSLELNEIKLSVQDCRVIHELVANDKMPNLELLKMSNTFGGGYMRFLFGESEIISFHSLSNLDMTRTSLNKSDLEILSQAITEDKVPQLQKLNLSCNILTESLDEILKSINQNLVELILIDTGLTDIDVKNLCSAITGKKFLKLKTLDLSCNTLTNHIGELFCATDEVLPCLCELPLIETALSKRDLTSLSEAVRSGKLPLLTEIHLVGNNQLQIKTELKSLMKEANIYIGHTFRKGGCKVFWCTWNPKRKLNLCLDEKDYAPSFLKRLKTAICLESTVIIGDTEWHRL